MKYLIALVLLLSGVVVCYGQEPSPSTNYAAQDEPQIVSEKIETRDLPLAVRQALEGQEYRGWLVNAAYKKPIDHVKHQEPEEKNDNILYVVELVSGSEIKTINFDKDGKRLEDQR